MHSPACLVWEGTSGKIQRQRLECYSSLSDSLDTGARLVRPRSDFRQPAPRGSSWGRKQTVQHTIRLPNGRRCTVATYVAAWRKLKEIPAGSSVAGFDHFPDDAGRILRQIRAGMHDRINRHDPVYGRGRKWDSNWYWETWR